MLISKEYLLIDQIYSLCHNNNFFKLRLKSIFVRASMNGWSCQSEHHMELGNMGGTVVAR